MTTPKNNHSFKSKMRILCLHGVGSSGSICESQLGAFLKVVDPSYEFVFVDGPALCERGPGKKTPDIS